MLSPIRGLVTNRCSLSWWNTRPTAPNWVLLLRRWQSPWWDIKHPCWDKHPVYLTLVCNYELRGSPRLLKPVYLVTFHGWHPLYEAPTPFKSVPALLQAGMWHNETRVLGLVLPTCALMVELALVSIRTIILGCVFELQLGTLRKRLVIQCRRPNLGVTGWAYRVVCYDAVYFKISEEVEILIVLLEFNLKHVLILFLFFLPDVVRIMYRILLHCFNCIQRNCGYRPGQVAHRVILVLVVPEGSRRELYPSIYEVPLYAWLKLRELSFTEYLFLWINHNLIDMLLPIILLFRRCPLP